jgi:hypothetical protein
MTGDPIGWGWGGLRRTDKSKDKVERRSNGNILDTGLGWERDGRGAEIFVECYSG